MRSSFARVISEMSSSSSSSRPNSETENKLLSDTEIPGDDLRATPSTISELYSSLDTEKDLNQPLLDEKDPIPELAPAPIPNNAEQEEFRVSRKPPKAFFYQDIETCLTYIKQLQKNMPEAIKKRRQVFLYYTGLFLFNITAGIASPVTLFKLMWAAAENNYQNLLPGWNKELNSLLAEFEPLQQKYAPLRNTLNQREDLSRSWWAYNCGEIFIECEGQTPPERCNNVQEQYCNIQSDLLKKYGSTTEAFKQAYLWEQEINDLQYQIDQLNNNIYGSHLTSHTVEPISISLFYVISIVAVAGIIYYGISYYNAYIERQEDIEKLHFVKDHINDPVHANLIINVASRLGLELDDLLIDDFADTLQMELDVVNDRWKKRLAFLNGNSDQDAFNNDFLLTDGARDITKSIFEMADLKESLRIK